MKKNERRTADAPTIRAIRYRIPCEAGEDVSALRLKVIKINRYFDII